MLKRTPRTLAQESSDLVATGRDEDVPEFMASALKEQGWASADRSSIKVKLCTGCSASQVYMVSAPGCLPESVVLHVRMEEADSASEACMSKAAKLFSAYGIAPPRVASGRNWFIEPWVGSPPDKPSDVEAAREMARLLAQIHKLPTDWFDEWRKRFVDRQPQLATVPSQSQIWFWMVYPALNHSPLPDYLESFIHEEYCPPKTAAGRRVVTCHGDFHPGNMLRADGKLLAIDFEMTCVSNAAVDVGRSFMWNTMNHELKFAFIETYLQESGLPSEISDINALFLDAELWKHPDDYGCFQQEGLSRTLSWLKSIDQAARGNLDAQAEILGGKSYFDFVKTTSLLQNEKLLDAGYDAAEYSKIGSLPLAPDQKGPLVEVPGVVGQEAKIEIVNMQVDNLSCMFWVCMTQAQALERKDGSGVVMSVGLRGDCGVEGSVGVTVGTFWIGLTSGNPSVRLHGGACDPAHGYVLRLQRSIADGTWHHCTVIYDSDKKTVELFVDGELVETCAYPLAQVVRLVNVAVPGVFEGLPEAPGKCPTPGCPYYQSPNVGAWSPAQTCCRPCKASGNHGGFCDKLPHAEMDPPKWRPDIRLPPGQLLGVKIFARRLAALEIKDLYSQTCGQAKPAVQR